MKRTVIAISAGAVLIAAVVLSLLNVPRSTPPGPYPSGLSAEVRAKFESYDAKVIATIRDINADEALVRKLTGTIFPKTHLVPILREVFDDWSAIRAYVDAALADLPRTDAIGRLGKPLYKVDLKNNRQFKLAKKSPEYEEILATQRGWDPLRVAYGASLAALEEIAEKETEIADKEVMLYSLTFTYAPRWLVRATWDTRDALVLYQGVWVFIIAYERTPRGLILPTEVGIYPR